MAPWSSRGPSLNPAHPHPASPTATYSPSPSTAAAGNIGGCQGAERGSTRANEHNPFENQYAIPTLHSQPDRGAIPANSSSSSELLTVPSRKSSNHSRSMSHPFPYLFSSKKKRHDNEQAAGPAPGQGEAGKSYGPALSGKSARPAAEQQLITGKCMTCDTTVKWPKDLGVYRCTVCTTVNDLKPVVRERPNPGSWGMSKNHPATSSPPHWRVAPLSKERTRWLIDRCVTRFLTEYLQQRQSRESKSSEGYLAVPDSPAVLVSRHPMPIATF